MGLFKDNKNESRQFFEPDIQNHEKGKKRVILSVLLWIDIITFFIIVA